VALSATEEQLDANEAADPGFAEISNRSSNRSRYAGAIRNSA
jgi:hypothetical protein